MANYKPTIGLEIHAELNTVSKMFCGCKNDPDEQRPNVNICEVCTAQPGALPVANEAAVRKVIKAGLALDCGIAQDSKFDRKNYFYPDLPKGYQISQYDQPFCEHGHLDIGDRRIGIRRIHLEEDTGSLQHPEGADYSLVDFNRAGVPLMELVTEPDITSGVEARRFAEELQLIFRYLGVSDADMEKGLMRVEVNISMSDNEQLGTKVEIKNLNSFRVVERAVDFEIARQTELLKNGGKVVQETRGWHDKKEITFSQREKEEAHDYRYFPDPDLTPMHFEQAFIDTIEAEIPELPAKKRLRFAKEYGLPTDATEQFVVNRELGSYFEQAASELDEWLKEEGMKNGSEAYKLAANYLLSDVIGLLDGAGFVRNNFKVTPENFAELVKLISKGEISSKVAKMVLPRMIEAGADPSNIVDENNWRQVDDTAALEKAVAKVLEANPKPVADYKAGKTNVIQFLQGQVMKETRGTANPKKMAEVLRRALQ